MSLDKIKIKFLTYGVNSFIALLLLCIVIGLPFALQSMLVEVVNNTSDSETFTAIELDHAENFTKLGILTKELDPINQTMRVTLSGYHNCKTDCRGQSYKLHISNFYFKKPDEKRVPERFEIEIPNGNTEFEQDIVLRVSGVLHKFPFDSYTMQTAIALEKEVNGISTFVEKNDRQIEVLVDENTSRLRNIRHMLVADVNTIITDKPPVVAFVSDYERPFYVKYIVSLLTILLIITTASTILLSEFSKLITGSAGIIIGVWGARSLLLGSMPQDVTIIDILLTMIVIGTLISVTVKSALYAKKNIKPK